ncbi:MAG TPA: hypothetical protein VFO73_11025 [Candidatus Limnocylindrales bacterium]|nr:hypothetical protein [Candidatus Limnocylindrales bacterium]
MSRPAALPAARLTTGEDFLAASDDADLVYFLCNVGDADAQLVLLPKSPTSGFRRAVVVDAGKANKLPPLIDDLITNGVIAPDGHPDAPGSIPLVVATHPHRDHLEGMADLIDAYPDGRIAEFWDPGYWHTIDAYHDTMAAIARQSQIVYAQPTSGFRRWIGSAAITVLSPSVQLRNRFDTYGTELNDSSISLRIEAPAIRVIRDAAGQRMVRPRASRLVLGADAQTLSWSYVLTDFPYLAASTTEQARLLDVGSGLDVLRANVLKISHHGSKHGVNLELVERMKPDLTLISSVPEQGQYGFPHDVAQELIREALEATTSGQNRSPDAGLSIFYTSDRDDAQPTKALGTIGVVLRQGEWQMWRFGDRPGDRVRLVNGRRWLGLP